MRGFSGAGGPSISSPAFAKGYSDRVRERAARRQRSAAGTARLLEIGDQLMVFFSEIVSVFVLREEADAGFLRFWRRCEKWTQLLVEIAQCRIMEEECVINLREPLHDGAVRDKRVATLSEGADDIETHLNRLRAVENIRRHKCAKLREGPRAVTNIPLRCG